MKKLAFLISLWLALPLFALAGATDGTDCKSVIGDENFNRSGVHCKILYDWDSDTDGPIVRVPLTGSACRTYVYVRTISGGNFDNFQVVALDDATLASGAVLHGIGVLDDDGTVTAGLCPDLAATNCGKTLIDIDGPSMPYMFINAGTSAGGLTSMIVYILQYECNTPG